MTVKACSYLVPNRVLIKPGISAHCHGQGKAYSAYTYGFIRLGAICGRLC